MPVERSAGIIIFRNTPRRKRGSPPLGAAQGRKYLVIRSSRDKSTIYDSHGRVRIAGGRRPKARFSHAEFWDLPKGVLEKGETGLDAAKREAKEEVGIENLRIVPDFKETVHYFTRRDGKAIPKYVAMFLAETKIDTVKLSWEHDKYEWLPYEEAHARITLKPMKGVLEKAEVFLNHESRIKDLFDP